MKYRVRSTKPQVPEGYREVKDRDELKELREKTRLKHKDPYEKENRLRSDNNQKHDPW